MTLGKAKAWAKAKHVYSTGIICDHYLRSSKYFYSTGHKNVFSDFLKKNRALEGIPFGKAHTPYTFGLIFTNEREIIV
jgi:hypothetical protein